MAKPSKPTEAQQQQALLVHHDVRELLAKLAGEGIDARIVVTGAAAALADVLSGTWGAESVAPWFASQADMVRKVFGGQG